MDFFFGVSRGEKVCSKKPRKWLFYFRDSSKKQRIGKSPEEGQAIVEYVLILALTMTIVVLMTQGILTAIDRGIVAFGARLEQKLKTGRTPVDVWTN